MDDPTILVVDDVASMQQIMVRLLRQIGYPRIELASNGRAAMQLLLGRSFDLVIADLHMEPMGGLELVRWMRETGRLHETRVILMSAEAKPENVITARDAGASAYLIKPFTANTLKEKIEELLAGRSRGAG
jgi:two-component system chemotaxis response regulator CheY